MKPNPKSFSPAELADFWGCSRKTILRIIRRGELPAVHLTAQTIRVMAADAAAFYAKNSVGLSPVAPVGRGSPSTRSCGRPWGSGNFRHV